MFIILVPFHSKIEQFLNLFVNKLFGGLQNIELQNPKKKKTPHFSKFYPREFPFTPYIFLKGYTWSIN